MRRKPYNAARCNTYVEIKAFMIEKLYVITTLGGGGGHLQKGVIIKRSSLY